MFHNLKYNDTHLIMQELRKIDFKINVIQNGFKEYMSVSLDNKLIFIDSFRFLYSSLDNLVKHVGEKVMLM